MNNHCKFDPSAGEFLKNRKDLRVFALVAVLALAMSPAAIPAVETQVLSKPGPPSGAPLYTGNRAPLTTNPFFKFPIGSITTEGWLKHQLELERDGMTGHLEEISKWCQFEGNAWSSPSGQGHSA